MKRIAALAPFRRFPAGTTGISIRALDHHGMGKKFKGSGIFFQANVLFSISNSFLFAVDNVDSLGNIPELRNSAQFLTG